MRLGLRPGRRTAHLLGGAVVVVLLLLIGGLPIERAALLAWVFLALLCAALLFDAWTSKRAWRNTPARAAGGARCTTTPTPRC